MVSAYKDVAQRIDGHVALDISGKVRNGQEEDDEDEEALTVTEASMPASTPEGSQAVKETPPKATPKRMATRNQELDTSESECEEITPQQKRKGGKAKESTSSAASSSTRGKGGLKALRKLTED